jgi:hypothetical protein
VTSRRGVEAQIAADRRIAPHVPDLLVEVLVMKREAPQEADT